jgi:hypothetical protein
MWDSAKSGQLVFMVSYLPSPPLPVGSDLPHYNRAGHRHYQSDQQLNFLSGDFPAHIWYNHIWYKALPGFSHVLKTHNLASEQPQNMTFTLITIMLKNHAAPPPPLLSTSPLLPWGT